MTQFGRRWALEIGQPGRTGRRLDGLHGSIVVRRSSTKAPDKADLTIANAAAETLGELAREGCMVRVLAGYGDDVQQVIEGGVVSGSLRVGRERPTPTTVVQIRDGGTSDPSRTIVSRSWSSRVTADEVLTRLLRDGGLARGVIDLGSGHTYERGTSYAGTVSRALTTLARDCGCVWSVQNGAVQVWPAGSQRATTAVRLAPDSGLIGSPMQADKGRVSAVSLLIPTMRPGDSYVIESRDYRGTYIAVDVEHRISIQPGGGDFTTTVVGRAA